MEADPPPQIEWFKNGNPLPQDDRLSVSDDGKHLTITKAEVSDTARYKCRAKNVAGETDKAFDLDVYGEFTYADLDLICCICLCLKGVNHMKI